MPEDDSDDEGYDLNDVSSDVEFDASELDEAELEDDSQCVTCNYLAKRPLIAFTVASRKFTMRSLRLPRRLTQKSVLASPTRQRRSCPRLSRRS